MMMENYPAIDRALDLLRKKYEGKYQSPPRESNSPIFQLDSSPYFCPRQSKEGSTNSSLDLSLLLERRKKRLESEGIKQGDNKIHEEIITSSFLNSSLFEDDDSLLPPPPPPSELIDSFSSSPSLISLNHNNKSTILEENFPLKFSYDSPKLSKKMLNSIEFSSSSNNNLFQDEIQDQEQEESEMEFIEEKELEDLKADDDLSRLEKIYERLKNKSIAKLVLDYS